MGNRCGRAPAARSAVANAGSCTTRLSRTISCRAQIRLIASDVDGTLLNSNQQLTTVVEKAVQRANSAGVPLVVATGKARGPWAKEVLPRLPRMPGVTLTAYCNDRILCAKTNQHTDRLKFYKEPTPEAVGSLNSVCGTIPIQKLIYMADQSRIDEIRPLLEAKLGGRVSITTALSGMLEILPLGASKGAGLQWLLEEHLGVDPKEVMALGDGENDIEMLQLVGLGVAMGNAGAGAKAAADAVVSSNDEDGVAEAIERFVLSPKSTGA